VSGDSRFGTDSLLRNLSYRSERCLNFVHRGVVVAGIESGCMHRLTRVRITSLLAVLLLTVGAWGQQLLFSGLLTANAKGQFNAVRTDAAGDLYLLLDEKDGVRVVKTTPGAASVLATAHMGAAGDSGVAMALDAAGDVYVAGTAASGQMAATGGAAFATAAGGNNSFVAKLDANLNVVFVSYCGGGGMQATAVAATADAVFATGNIYGATLPVTASAILQQPAAGTVQNGFVERFSADGRRT